MSLAIQAESRFGIFIPPGLKKAIDQFIEVCDNEQPYQYLIFLSF